MPMTTINLDQDTLEKLAISATARSLSQEALIQEAVKDIYEDDAMLAAIVAKSRADVTEGRYFTQEQVEQDTIELIRQIDNLA